MTLPVRIHELLLSFAGRLDDDALSDARQMLASAELDRSLEFIAGCVVAGNIVLSKTQHRDLEALFAETYLDSSLIERVVVRDPVPAVRHHFAVGEVEGREPERGVADAIRSVLGVLPDVRSVRCVWRLTPAGPASGPVPHRVVLIEVGPGGFPPATAYRADDALRRSGIRASVEVLPDGTEPGEYHQEAMRAAREVPFDELSGDGPGVSPVEAVRVKPFGGEPRHSQPTEPPRPVTLARPALAPPVEPPRAEIAAAPAGEQPLPPPVELPKAAPTLSPAIELRRAPEPPAELPPPVELHAAESSMPTPPSGMLMPPVEATAPADAPSPPPPGPRPVPSPKPRPGERTDVFAPAKLSEAPTAEPADPAASALHPETPTNSRPAPRRRPPEGTRPRLVPAADPKRPDDQSDNHASALADDILNTQERNLLRELQDELARREQQDQGGAPSTSTWFGRHGASGPDGPPPGGPMPVNGMPPSPDGGYPPPN